MTPSSVLGLVSYKVFPAQMGGQKCVAQFYAHLSKTTAVSLAVPKNDLASGNVGYTVLPLLYDHWWGFLNLLKVYRLSKIISKKNISHLIIEHSYFGWLGLLLKRITKIPVIIRSHNIEAHRFRDLQRGWWRLYEWYEKNVHRRVDHSFFITPEDMSWAIANWQLDAGKCSILTYGTDITAPVSDTEKQRCRAQLVNDHQLDPAERLFLFSGSLDYLPNTDALRILITEIIPLLLTAGFRFRIFLCGAHLNSQWQEVIKAYPNIIYKGFVEQLDKLTAGVDCFINPVTLGSGIKTKLVETLALSQRAISTAMGAKGLSKEMFGNQLTIVADYDWPSFAARMMDVDVTLPAVTPAIFYSEFNWDHIVQKALLSLQPNE